MSVTLVAPLTSKERLYAQYRIEGLEKKEAALKAGFGPATARNATTRIETPEMLAMIESAQKELTAIVVTRGLVNAVELHEHVTDELRGDIADLYSETGELLPIKEWPLWARQGGVEILDEPNMVHSADGGGGSWDQVGRRIKIKSINRAKAREFAAGLKAVDAMVQPSDKLAGAVGDLASTIDRAISEGRQRAAQRNKLPINVTPSE